MRYVDCLRPCGCIKTSVWHTEVVLLVIGNMKGKCICRGAEMIEPINEAILKDSSSLMYLFVWVNYFFFLPNFFSGNNQNLK
jgi:hypothetical protein